jgi:hypothetical protein
MPKQLTKLLVRVLLLVQLNPRRTTRGAPYKHLSSLNLSPEADLRIFGVNVDENAISDSSIRSKADSVVRDLELILL